MQKPSGLTANFENKGNPAFSTEESTYLLINKHGIEVEVPESIWRDHMRKPMYGYQYLGLKGEVNKARTAEEVIADQPEIEYGTAIGGDKPIKTIGKMGSKKGFEGV
jgi:hypothetical protein